MRAIPEPMVRYRAAGAEIYLAKDPALIHEVLVMKSRHFNKGRSVEEPASSSETVW